MNVRVDEFLAARDATRSLGKAIERLANGEVEKYVIVNRNQPMAVLLSIARYEAMAISESNLAAQVIAAEAERDRLAEALRHLVAAIDEYPGPYPDREEEIAALQQARAALAALEEK
jgi:PHD/YefM family antitoxin component YafN of YafNO toxin-antitoxin module